MHPTFFDLRAKHQHQLKPVVNVQGKNAAASCVDAGKIGKGVMALAGSLRSRKGLLWINQAILPLRAKLNQTARFHA
jgi:hypothetical protein